jgi:hypothetical protein
MNMNNVACIDLEGVLTPEVWPYIGETAGISGYQLPPAKSRITRSSCDIVLHCCGYTH